MRGAVGLWQAGPGRVGRRIGWIADGDFMMKNIIQGAGGGGGGGKGGGGSGGSSTEDPNTLRSRAVARLIDVISEGEIGGLYAGEQSIFFDETPLLNSDGTYNFSGVTWQARTGVPAQDPVSGFSDIETEVSVGVRVKSYQPVVRLVTNPDLNAVRLTMMFPALYDLDPSSGNMHGSEVAFAVDVQSNLGRFQTVLEQTVSGKCTSRTERSYRINLPAGGAPWTLRVRRLSGESDRTSLQNETWWSSYTEIIEERLTYPDTAYIALAVDSQLFGGSVPKRSYDVVGIKIEVPKNYNPDTRSYSGIWDGSFQVAVSDNPAWVLRDLLVNKRYGLGGFLSAGQIDKWALYDIARYCDELVPDGYGGLEPRFTFNATISSREQAYQVVEAIAACFRGMVFWGAGTVTASQDAPADPVKLVTPANVIGGVFNYEATGLKARHTAALVTWTDPEDGFKSAVETVEDTARVRQYGWRQLEITAFGCTSRGQARRVGRWAIDSEWTQTETVTYRAAFDHADVRPGDVVLIQDPDWVGARMAGRLVAVDATSVTVDQAVVLSPGQSYILRLVLPDGTLVERPLSNSAGSATVLTFWTPLAVQPLVGAIWMLGSVLVAPRAFRVVSVSEAERGVFQITALFHDNDKYVRVEQNILFDPPDVSTLPKGPLLPPSDLSWRDYLYSASGVRSALSISWQASPDPRVSLYEVEYQAPTETSFRSFKTVSVTSVDIPDTVPGIYQVRVRALDVFNRSSRWLLETNVEVLGLLAPPAAVTGFTAHVIDGVAYLSWDAVPDLDLSHYRLRFSSATSGALWAGATDLVARIAAPATSITLPAQVGSYLIKAVDQQGVESTDPAIVISTVARLQTLNVVATLDEALAFAGAKDKCALARNILVPDGSDTVDVWPDLDEVLDLDRGSAGYVGDGLQLAGADVTDEWDDWDNITSTDWGLHDVASLGIYDFANSCDLGAVYTVRVTQNLQAIGLDLTSLPDLWGNVDIVSNWDGSVPSGWDARIELRTSSDALSASPSWSGWQTLLTGDYTARSFQFRLILQSLASGVSVFVNALAVTIDAPDRTISGDSIVCPSAGISVNFAQPFMAVPSIAITGHALQSGDIFTISGKTRSGFTLQFLNSGNVGVARTFDWVAKGYGAEG
jgi:predicted phage tail protein